MSETQILHTFLILCTVVFNISIFHDFTKTKNNPCQGQKNRTRNASTLTGTITGTLVQGVQEFNCPQLF